MSANGEEMDVLLDAVRDTLRTALSLSAVECDVTVRTGHSPRDRKRDGGAWALALRVRGVIHMSYAVRTAALAANSEVDFVEPPCFLSANQLPTCGPDWFWSEATGSSRDR